MGDEDAVWAAIEASNAAWTGGRAQDAGALFAPDAVMVAAGLAGALEGRAALTASYVEYAAAATTEAFEILDRRVDLFGDLAVATYTFRVRYTLRGETEPGPHEERGQEVLVLRRRDDSWQAVWRTQLPVPPAAT